MKQNNRVIGLPQHLKDDLEAFRDTQGFTSYWEAVEFLLAKHDPAYIPLHKRPLSELEALAEREPTRAGLRSAYLAAKAGVE